jgi:hypothetical protein
MRDSLGESVTFSMVVSEPKVMTPVLSRHETFLRRSSHVPIRRNLQRTETLLAIDRARNVLGYQPEHSWRDHVS